MKRLARQVFRLAILTGSLAYAGQSLAAEDAPVFGVLAPLSGPFEPLGRQVLRGVEAALAVAGARLVVEDDHCTEGGGRDGANRLVGAGARIIIGSLCWRAGLAAAGVLKQEGGLLISPAMASARFTEDGLGGMVTFQLSPGEAAYPAALAAAAINEAGGKPIVILASAGLYGEALKADVEQALIEHGVRPAHVETVEASEAAAMLASEHAQAEGAGVVIVLGGHADAASLVRALRQRLADVEILGADALQSPEFALLAGEAAEGVLFVANPDYRSLADPVRLASLDEGGEPATGLVLPSLAASEIALAVAGNGGQMPSAPVATILGALSFNAVGQVTSLNPSLYVYREGVPVVVSP